MKIDVKPFPTTDEFSALSPGGKRYDELPIDIRFTKTHIILSFPEEFRGANIEVTAGDVVLFTGSIGKKGEIKIERATSIAQEIIKLMNKGQLLVARLK